MSNLDCITDVPLDRENRGALWENKVRLAHRQLALFTHSI
jgi:hypothetical protein